MGRNKIHLFELSISCEWLILLLLPNDYYYLQIGEQVILYIAFTTDFLF